MRISAKGRYALAAMVTLAQQYDEGRFTTVISISERTGISKKVLEQVFAQLKKNNLVSSSKGAQGGYLLAAEPDRISALDVLSTIEASIFEPTQATTEDSAPDIERTLQKSIFETLDKQIEETLRGISIGDLSDTATRYRTENAIMFYI
ncbi:MAG: RrF2 family transcriptional regulator [Sphaerochaetaceae bacterium]|jgi:Rrf2 family protein